MCKNLEKEVKKPCPFTTTKSLGVYMLAGKDKISYECGINGRAAKMSEDNPCDMGYAKNCPTYQATVNVLYSWLKN